MYAESESKYLHWLQNLTVGSFLEELMNSFVND